MLEKYINIFEYGNEQFYTKQQVLKVYFIYIETLSEKKNLIANKIKEQG